MTPRIRAALGAVLALTAVAKCAPPGIAHATEPPAEVPAPLAVPPTDPAGAERGAVEALPPPPAPVLRIRVLVQTARLAGLAHHDAKQVWPRLAVGDALALVREADNVHDRDAVRVDWQGRVLGYLPADDNADVARQLDRGQPLEAEIVTLARHRNHRLKLELRVHRGLDGRTTSDADRHDRPGGPR
jgi:hypothetical protein